MKLVFQLGIALFFGFVCLPCCFAEQSQLNNSHADNFLPLQTELTEDIYTENADTSELDSRYPKVSLPVPKFRQKKLFNLTRQKSMKPIPVITWEISRQQGLQRISEVPFVSVFQQSNSEIVFQDTNYKRIMVLVDVDTQFQIISNFTMSFLKEATPFEFTIDLLPFYYQKCNSMELDVYVGKSFLLPNAFALQPVLGYAYSYFMYHDINDDSNIFNKRFHSVVLGCKAAYKIARIITLNYGIFFSPTEIPFQKEIDILQLGYETGMTVDVGFVSFSVMMSTKNNIEKITTESDYNTFHVTEAGFKIRFEL